MELTNKTVCFLGDSITEGAGASHVDNCFVSLFGAKYPDAHVYNFGIGGTRIARQAIPSECDRWDKHFSSRIEEMPESADLICVFGGTNDFGHGDARFGSFGDTTDDSFFGALYDLSQKLVNKYPFAKIVFFTPLHRETENNIAKRPDGCFVLEDYVNAIKENAAYFSLPVLDLWSVSEMQPALPIIKETFMPDGLHPNDAGYVKLFQTVDSFIEKL